MIIFRPHRGMLSEALAEAKEFRTVWAMKWYIITLWTFKVKDDKGKLHSVRLINYRDIVIDDKVIDDERCNWHDTRHVCIKRLGDEDFIAMYRTPQCIGMCATKYEKGVIKS